MPHGATASSLREPSAVESSGDDFASTDEVKVYKDEGEDEQRSSENLSEDKLGLVTETEEDTRASDANHGRRYADDRNKSSDKLPDYRLSDHLLFGYPFLSSYPYGNGSALTSPGKLFAPHPGLSLYMYNNESLVNQPPPAHSGILPLHLDPKTGLPRSTLYGLPPPGRLYGTDFTPLQFDLMAQTNAAAAAGLFAGSLSPWFGPPPPAGLLASHPPPPTGSVRPSSGSGPVQDLSLTSSSASPVDGSSFDSSRQQPSNNAPKNINHTFTNLDENSTETWRPATGDLDGAGTVGGGTAWSSAVAMMASDRQQFLLRYSHQHQHHQQHILHHHHQQLHHHHHQRQLQDQVPKQQRRSQLQKTHVKKPLNAFMIFMKEMRQSVIDQCTLKESAAINQILGRRWHALDRTEQAKYYDMARKEKELHMQLYPGWSARDNYATHTKKKKLKRDPMQQTDHINALTGVDYVCPNMRKCRSRYGVEQQNLWCKICRFDGDTSSTENSLVSSPYPALHGEVAVESSPFHSLHSSLSAPPPPQDAESAVH